MLKIPAGRYNPFRLLYKNFLRFTRPVASREFSNVVIDVLIPTVEKDLDKLKEVILCAREYITNPIGKFYIVGKKGVIEQFCRSFNCVFLDEDVILPIKKADLKFEGKEWFRSGWLFQQLIKLSVDSIIPNENENVLVLDSDTCLTSKQSFVLNDDTYILNFSDEYHFPYQSYSGILGLKKRFYLSFVCHHMLFNKRILKKMKHDIEEYTNSNWINAILRNIDYKESSLFSEYEMYGNYAFYNFKNSIHLEYWNNKSVRFAGIEKKIIESSLGKFKSVSFI